MALPKSPVARSFPARSSRGRPGPTSPAARRRRWQLQRRRRRQLGLAHPSKRLREGLLVLGPRLEDLRKLLLLNRRLVGNASGDHALATKSQLSSSHETTTKREPLTAPYLCFYLPVRGAGLPSILAPSAHLNPGIVLNLLGHGPARHIVNFRVVFLLFWPQVSYQVVSLPQFLSP